MPMSEPVTSGIYRQSHDRYGRRLTFSFRELYAMWVDSLAHSVIAFVVPSDVVDVEVRFGNERRLLRSFLSCSLLQPIN